MSAQYPVSPRVVWEELRHLERHVNWMHDAVRITFSTDLHEGVGTQFVCDTKIGPFRTRDLMSITEWVRESTMGVAHQGLITGEGRFTLSASASGTVLDWHERLVFPWWLGGPLGAQLAKPILRRIWRRNLELLGHCLAT